MGVVLAMLEQHDHHRLCVLLANCFQDTRNSLPCRAGWLINGELLNHVCSARNVAAGMQHLPTGHFSKLESFWFNFAYIAWWQIGTKTGKMNTSRGAVP